jgi:hypothetical protein
MTVTISGSGGISSPGGDVASVSVTTPLIGAGSGSSLSLQSNGTTNATLDTSGRWWVGTTSGSTTFLSTLDSSSLNIGFTFSKSGAFQGAIGIDTGGSIISGSSAGSLSIRSSGGPLLFSTGGTGAEVGRFDNSGNLLVGTTSTYNSAKVAINGDLESHGNIKTHYGNYGTTLTNGSTLTLMSFSSGSYGAPVDGVLTVENRDDNGGNLTTSTYLLSGYGGAGASFTAVSTVGYGSGQGFTIAATSTGGNLTIYITNTAGRSSTSVNFTFLALKGGGNIAYNF